MNEELIIHILDLFGVAVFAASGALVAGRKRMDIFGVIVLGLVTALGGGTLRDILLNSGPVFWIADRSYLVIGTAAAALTFIIVRRHPAPIRALLLSDALGLAVFTLIGTAKTLETTGSQILAVVLGTMTGVAGGMIRDILSAEVPLILRKEVYATACICGSVIYVALNHLALPKPFLIVIPILTTLLLRVAAIRWGLSLPRFVPRQEGEKKV